MIFAEGIGLPKPAKPAKGEGAVVLVDFPSSAEVVGALMVPNDKAEEAGVVVDDAPKLNPVLAAGWLLSAAVVVSLGAPKLKGEDDADASNGLEVGAVDVAAGVPNVNPLKGAAGAGAGVEVAG